MERWGAVDSESTHLATMRIYTDDHSQRNGKPRILLYLPPNKDPSNPSSATHIDPTRPKFNYVTNLPTEADCYELEMLQDDLQNQIVVAERPKDSSLSVAASSAAQTTNTRSRTTILTGRVKHDCTLRPLLSESYRKQMADRDMKYSTPAKVTEVLRPEDIAGGRGALNKISSGAGVDNTFSDFVVWLPLRPRPKSVLTCLT